MPTFYINPAIGDDSRADAVAQDPATPWRSFGPLNAKGNNGIAAGTVIKIARGAVITGANAFLLINSSGALGNEIVVDGDSWGSRALPLPEIRPSFAAPKAGWTLVSGSVWKIGGVPQPVSADLPGLKGNIFTVWEERATGQTLLQDVANAGAFTAAGQCTWVQTSGTDYLGNNLGDLYVWASDSSNPNLSGYQYWACHKVTASGPGANGTNLAISTYGDHILVRGIRTRFTCHYGVGQPYKGPRFNTNIRLWDVEIAYSAHDLLGIAADNTNSVKPDIWRCRFTGCQNFGAGIFDDGSSGAPGGVWTKNIEFRNCDFIDIQGAASGGLVPEYNCSDITAYDCRFINCSAGVVALSNLAASQTPKNVKLYRPVFRSNAGNTDVAIVLDKPGGGNRMGSGFYAEGVDCRGLKGGVLVFSDQASPVTGQKVARSYFEGPGAVAGSIGVYLAGNAAGFEIETSVVAKFGAATTDAGILVASTGASHKIRHVTLDANWNNLAILSGATMTVQNNVSTNAFGTGGYGFGYYIAGSGHTTNNNLARGNTTNFDSNYATVATGDGSLPLNNADPLYSVSSGRSALRDFQPSAGSPCFAAGVSTTVTLDAAGKAWSGTRPVGPFQSGTFGAIVGRPPRKIGVAF